MITFEQPISFLRGNLFFLVRHPSSLDFTMNINRFLQTTQSNGKRMWAKGLYRTWITAKTIRLFQREMVLILLFEVGVIQFSTFIFCVCCIIYVSRSLSFLLYVSCHSLHRLQITDFCGLETGLAGTCLLA